MASGFTMIPYTCPRDYPKPGPKPSAPKPVLGPSK